MSSNVYRFFNRRDMANDWAYKNPILGPGEIGFELDTNKFKIGDGCLHWNDLPYQNVIGPTGPQGVTGPTGPIGATGAQGIQGVTGPTDRKSTRLNSSHSQQSRMPSSA